MNFRGSGNPYISVIFQGGSGPPVPPLDQTWHASERRYLSDMFRDHRTQKVGLDYNSWYASDDLRLQTLIAGRKSRERERDCTVFAHESFVLAWFLRISKHNVWVSQSILLQLLPMRTQNPNLSCASAFVRQSRTFLVYFLSHAHIFKLTKHSILNTIRV